MFAVERVHFNIVQVAAFRDREAELIQRLQAAGWELPTLGHAVAATHGRIALAVIPGRWLLLDAQSLTLAHDCVLAAGDAAAVVELTSARSVWRISGESSREALAAGCRLDLHPAAFASGRAAGTLIAQVHSVLVALPQSMLLLASASMSKHVGDWLQHIGGEMIAAHSPH